MYSDMGIPTQSLMLECCTLWYMNLLISDAIICDADHGEEGKRLKEHLWAVIQIQTHRRWFDYMPLCIHTEGLKNMITLKSLRCAGTLHIHKTGTKGVVPVISSFVNLCPWVAKHCESIQPTRCDIKLHILYYQYILWKLNVFAIFHIPFTFRRTYIKRNKDMYTLEVLCIYGTWSF